MNKITSFFKKLIKDESAQGATEYILLLVVVVGLVVAFGPKIKTMISAKVEELSSGVGEVTIK